MDKFRAWILTLPSLTCIDSCENTVSSAEKLIDNLSATVVRSIERNIFNIYHKLIIQL